MPGLPLDLRELRIQREQRNREQCIQREQDIQRYIQSLVHASHCRRDANCRLLSCKKMKRIITHAKICSCKSKLDCPICKQLLAICCYHAKHCQDTSDECSVPYCRTIKKKCQQLGLEI